MPSLNSVCAINGAYLKRLFFILLFIFVLKTVLVDKLKEKKSQNPCIRNNVSKSSFVMDIFSFFIGDGGVLDWDTMYVGEEKIHKCAI